MRRGVRVVVNKDGIVNLPTVSTERPTRKIPSQVVFDELVSDFLYHAVWTAKKLSRGELLIAHACCNGYMKRMLLRMMELQALAARGWDYDTWFVGRFLEEWADPKALRGLRTAYAYYDEKDVHRASLATMDLFRGIARETAAMLRLAYPEDKDNKISGMVTEILGKKQS